MITDFDTIAQDFGLVPVRRAVAVVPDRRAVSFAIEDEQEFARTVPAKGGQRQKVRRLLAVLEDIHLRWACVLDGCKHHARLLERAGVRGMSCSRLRTLYYQFTDGGKRVEGTLLFKAGDWRILARLKRTDGNGIAQRHEFIQLWQTLCDKHQRHLMPAFADLVSLYHTGYTKDGQKIKGVVWGESFPGYTFWPEAQPHTGLPEAWSYERLTRYAPDRFERTAARTGIKKASSEGFKARFSRVGVLPYQLLSGDDEVQDVQCLVPGQRQPVRPRGLGLHDYATDALVAYVMKAAWWNEDEQKLKVLSERDTMWFIVGHLTHTGYRSDTGTQVLVERGTFAVRGDTMSPARPVDHPDRVDLEARIWRVTGGKVTFARSQGFARPAHGGQFAPPVGGNPRFKPIEGAWARLRNRVDSLPGQTGKDRNHKPESMGREEANAVQVLKSIGLLPAEQAEKLALPFLTYAELSAQVYQAIDDLNNDPEHAIKEWEKCGFIVKEYFDAVAGQWFPLPALPERVKAMAEAEAMALAESLKANPTYLRARRMTRAEALATGKAALKRVPLAALLDLVGREHAMNKGQLKAVSGGELTFDCAEIDADQIAYAAVDADGQPLREGERFLCVVNPLFPDECVIYDAQERFVSVCPRRVAAVRTDESAVMRMVGEVKIWRDTKLAPMRARHGEDAARVEFIRSHQAAVLNAARPELAKARQQEREQVRAHAAFSSAAAEEFLAGVAAGEEPEAVTVSEPSAADDFLNAL